MHIIHTIKANLLKNKGNTLSLFLIITIISILFNMGFTIISQIDSLCAQKMDQLNSPHNFFILPQNEWQPSYLDYFKNNEKIKEYELESVVFANDSTCNYNGEINISLAIQNADTKRSISPLKFIEKDTSIPEDEAVYLPIGGKADGYSLGDTYTFTYRNIPYSYKVAGFYEKIEMVKASVFCGNIMIHDKNFKFLEQQIGKYNLLSVVSNKSSDSFSIINEFRNVIDIELSALGGNGIAVDYELITGSLLIPLYSIASMILSFAVILIIITLFVIHFRVTNNIENNMHNIGVLKSTGYTSKEIIQGLLIEYSFIISAALFFGIICTYFTIPFIRFIMISTTSILFDLKATLVFYIAASIIVYIFIIFMVLLASRKIKKLQPIIALRGGVATHSFRFNFFPLQKGIGSVHLRLGLKNVFMFGKLYILTGIIFACVAFVLLFSSVTYSNFILDRSSFVKMVGVEIADITITVPQNTDAYKLVEQLESMEDVRKTSMTDWDMFKVDNFNVVGMVTDDYYKLETLSVYEGEPPVLDNEIIIPGLFAKNLNKKIGDTVEVKKQGLSKEFIITGLFSTTNNSGYTSLVTLEGIKGLSNNYERKSINVYLTDDVVIDDFITTLKNTYGVTNVPKISADEKYASAKKKAEEKISNYLRLYNIDSVEYAVMYNGKIIFSGGSNEYEIEKIINYRQLIESQIGNLSVGLNAVIKAFIVIILLIVILVLSIIIKAVINKRQKELGILKANGYQSIELAFQIANSFLPSVSIGTIFGIFLGSILINPVFTGTFSSMGVHNVSFAIHPLQLIIIFISLISITYFIVMLFIRRIKSISVYKLISE